MGGLGKGIYEGSVRREKGRLGEEMGWLVGVNTHNGGRDTEGMETAVQ